MKSLASRQEQVEVHVSLSVPHFMLVTRDKTYSAIFLGTPAAGQAGRHLLSGAGVCAWVEKAFYCLCAQGGGRV